MRVNELRFFSLKNWTGLKEGQTTEVYESKTKKYRRIFINKRAQRECVKLSKHGFEQLFSKPGQVLLSNSRGQVLQPDSTIRRLNVILKPFGQAWNLNLKTHSFRISLITRLFEKNVDSVVIKDIIGHSKLDTTLRYKRGTTTDQVKLQAINRL